MYSLLVAVALVHRQALKEVVEGADRGIGYVGDISRRPTNGEPNTGSGGGSFYISGSNVSGGCYSGAGGSGIIILRYMKYK